MVTPNFSALHPALFLLISEDSFNPIGRSGLQKTESSADAVHVRRRMQAMAACAFRSAFRRKTGCTLRSCSVGDRRSKLIRVRFVLNCSFGDSESRVGGCLSWTRLGRYRGPISGKAVRSRGPAGTCPCRGRRSGRFCARGRQRSINCSARVLESSNRLTAKGNSRLCAMKFSLWGQYCSGLA